MAKNAHSKALSTTGAVDSPAAASVISFPAMDRQRKGRRRNAQEASQFACHPTETWANTVPSTSGETRTPYPSVWYQSCTLSFASLVRSASLPTVSSVPMELRSTGPTFEVLDCPLEPISRVGIEHPVRGPGAGHADIIGDITEKSIVFLDVPVLGESPTSTTRSGDAVPLTNATAFQMPSPSSKPRSRSGSSSQSDAGDGTLAHST